MAAIHHQEEVNMNISQAAQASGVTAKMIRYYESVGLIQEARRSDAGYRKYTDKDIQTMRFIRRSRDLGFSLERIKTLLGLWGDRSRKSSDVKTLARQYIAELDDQIAKLASIRVQLEKLADSCHGDHRPDCPIIEDLANLPDAPPEHCGPGQAFK
jgi:MerR family copper efflux transcriptional regulator